MYNTIGIVYKIFPIGFIMLLISFFVLLTSKFWNPKLKNKKLIISSIIAILISVVYIVFYVFILFNPTVEIIEGELSSKYSAGRGRGPFTWKYSFDTGNDKDIVVYIDSFSRKKMLPDGLNEGDTYRVTYEKYTNIILSV